MILEIEKGFLDKIRREAITGAKNQIEVCGLIIGEIRGDRAIVTEVRQARNVLKSPVRFQIDPIDFLKALEEAEDMGLDVIGFYHSHPAPPYPSLVDRKYMLLWPGKIWLIVSTLESSPSEPSVRAFISRTDEFEEMIIVEKPPK